MIDVYVSDDLLEDSDILSELGDFVRAEMDEIPTITSYPKAAAPVEELLRRVGSEGLSFQG